MPEKPGPRKSWTCYYCGQTIVEGQKLTFTKRGPVHWECFRVEVSEKFGGRIPEDVEVLMELVDLLNEGIVKLKELGYRAWSSEVRQAVEARRKVLEGEAARAMSELVEAAKRHGVEI